MSGPGFLLQIKSSFGVQDGRDTLGRWGKLNISASLVFLKARAKHVFCVAQVQLHEPEVAATY